MIRTTLMALAMVAGLAAPALADNRSFSLTGFDKIDASNHVRVVLKQGPYSVQVSEPEGRFDDLVLTVRGSTLVTSRRSQNNWTWSRRPPSYTITVSAPSWSSVEVSNHADLQGEINAPALTLTASNHADISGKFTARTLTLGASNHADIVGELSTDSLSARAGNHGGMRLTGRCGAVEAAASNHGRINSQALKCDDARLSATNHGSVAAWASRQANARATNHGGVRIYGNPPSYQADASNHGSVGRS